MDDRDWIMSEGGPLIMMEEACRPFWGGVFRSTDAQSSVESDYHRLATKLSFIQSISLSNGEALIFGEGSLDTAFFSSKNSQKFIIRTIYCEPDFDANTFMLSVNEQIFGNTREAMEFTFQSPNLVMFDSAEDGAVSDIHCVTTSIEPGKYRILTKIHEPDEFTSLILHRFDRIA